MKVLVIDDDKTMRDVLIRALSSFLKFDALESDDAQSSIEIFLKERPELVFLDLQIPRIDASAILEEFTKITPDVKVVFMAGFGFDEKAIPKVSDQSLVARINKPFKLEELRSTVEKLLNIEPQKDTTAQPAVKTSFSKERHGISVFKYIGAVIFVVIFGGLFWSYLKTQGAQSISFDTLNIASLNISSVAVYKNFFYIADWLGQRIYLYRVGKILDLVNTYKLEKTQPTAISVEKSSLWVADSLQGNISHYRFEGNDIVFVRSYRSPGPAPSGVYVDGKYLWSYDIDSKKIYKHSIKKDLAVIHSYDMPIEYPGGFTKFRGAFYLGDTKTNRILKLSYNDLNLQKICILSQYEASREKMLAFGSDDKSFWSISESGKIYRHAPRELKTILR